MKVVKFLMCLIIVSGTSMSILLAQVTPAAKPAVCQPGYSG
jgi:hypothetical protein